jgi:two-component system sensor histidine kinase FlrB
MVPVSGQAVSLEELITRFQSASESLECAYRELQSRVQSLTQELEKEREERIRLERLAAMGEMAMELAHEIRNPLGSIELYASMLQGQYAEQIVQSVRLLNHSVTNVLQFGNPIVPRPARMSVGQLLEGIRTFLQPIAQQKQIRIVTECEPDCIAVADFELLHRMLLNLVLNALREIPADGIVSLKARIAARDILIEVEDTGPGIHEDRVAHIFDPMFSTGREGSGLGLPIVKRIVESHHGTIAVDSASPGGAGTRFLISIPHNTEVVLEPVACCR